MPTVIVEQRDCVLHIGLNRPAKRNAFNIEMVEDLGRPYERLERDDALRVGVLFAHGENFTAGLDLAQVGPRLMAGALAWPADPRNPGAKAGAPDDARNPWRNDGRPWTKPVVAAVQGWCLTLGIELLLAADVRIASADARFAQLEVQRGCYPFGGATPRLPREAGWGNAMRWLLTGDEFDAAEAHRIGLVQEVADDGAAALARAREIAQTIAERAAPLGVRATLASAHLAREQGETAAIERLRPVVAELFASEDAAEGVQSFIERRQARFQAR